MNYDTLNKNENASKDDWGKFELNVFDGAWYLRYIAGAFSLGLAYLFVQYLGYDQKTAVAILGLVIGVGFAHVAAIMWREVSFVTLGLLAIYLAYVAVVS
jgi:hypothetical protein